MASMAVSLFQYFHQTVSVLILNKMLRQIFNQFHTYLPPTSVPGSIPRLWRPQRHMGVDFVVSSFYSEYFLESNYHCYYMFFLCYDSHFRSRNQVSRPGSLLRVVQFLHFHHKSCLILFVIFRAFLT